MTHKDQVAIAGKIIHRGKHQKLDHLMEDLKPDNMLGAHAIDGQVGGL